MDGVVPTTLSAVLIASASAVGSAIYKVIFKKLMGCVTFAQVRSPLSCSERVRLSSIQYPLPNHNLLMGQFSDTKHHFISEQNDRDFTPECPIFIYHSGVTLVWPCQLIP